MRPSPLPAPTAPSLKLGPIPETRHMECASVPLLRTSPGPHPFPLRRTGGHFRFLTPRKE